MLKSCQNYKPFDFLDFKFLKKTRVGEDSVVVIKPNLNQNNLLKI